ncbi:hypothetical protein D5R40_00680 [Okeania hirsuta]|uniref:Uncharacterized protein n=1 Tax=Okeania hirsuta TaxID=1458930 RepID=A0A3N6QRP7_9CYAN|nr:hypothetical protein D4Z78_21455 [Okeania hirsuta]RQH57523.1 hypothetical protein D5R40_00680 [Okeania hirsuta]
MSFIAIRFWLCQKFLRIRKSLLWEKKGNNFRFSIVTWVIFSETILPRISNFSYGFSLIVFRYWLCQKFLGIRIKSTLGKKGNHFIFYIVAQGIFCDKYGCRG